MVDESIREAWVAEATAQTCGRVEAFEAEEASFVTQAQDEYGESLSDLREAVVAVTDGGSADSHESMLSIVSSGVVRFRWRTRWPTPSITSSRYVVGSSGPSPTPTLVNATSSPIPR